MVVEHRNQLGRSVKSLLDVLLIEALQGVIKEVLLLCEHLVRLCELGLGDLKLQIE